MENDYSDIIKLPHHVSCRHPKMSMENRAAQFAPFAALTGYDAAIDETARLTDEMKDLSLDKAEALNYKLMELRGLISQRPTVTFVYFEPDDKKTGGAYISCSGIVKRIDEIGRVILLESGTVIPIDRLIALEW